MSDYYDDTVFDEEADDDLFPGEDGRDGQPYGGSSDAPETMAALDPLRKHAYLTDDDLEKPEDLDNEDDGHDKDEDAEWPEEDDGFGDDERVDLEDEDRDRD
ncbi:hypothetical protein ACQ3I4_06280 [Zafaria sp. Z1313]|uniref:hypothetical protein n=1 Tax=unclassified Zafaria TaxID=2828765 RepID=UPI002E7A5B2D|nr:hypothetical protein [Zafaria sp. J156]MEE1621562.1 hypothetical protein [Zafaria sp. J156]